MFYISFVVGEDQFYYWADTDSVDEANKSWFEHVASSPEFAPFDHSARRELYDPVLMRDETAVWSLGIAAGEGDDLDVLLAYAVGPIRVVAPLASSAEPARRRGAV